MNILLQITVIDVKSAFRLPLSGIYSELPEAQFMSERKINKLFKSQAPR